MPMVQRLLGIVSIGLTVWTAPLALAAESGFALRNIGIVGETNLNQTTNFAPVFHWEYSHPAADYLLKMKLVVNGNDQDSLLWDSGVITATDNQFRFSGLGVFEKGQTYRFYVAAKHPDLGWSDSVLVTFRMNTPPTVPAISLPSDTVFLEKVMRFRIVPATDLQLNSADLQYQVRISADSAGRQMLLDTTFQFCHSQMQVEEFFTAKSLPDNHQYFISARSFDGAEYSAWSQASGFKVNRINEPPRRFNLIEPVNEAVVKKPPRLSWEKTSDPDDEFGTGLSEYLIEIATDPDFNNMEISRALSATNTEWVFENCRNHVRYYWRVVAGDAIRAYTTSENVSSFICDFGNRPPQPPFDPSPVGEKIIQPDDYLEWTLGEDQDFDQFFSCEITIQDQKDPEQTKKVVLSDTLLRQAQTVGVTGIALGYDGRVRFRLNLIEELSFFRDDHVYQWSVQVSDGWGGSAQSNWKNATFRFDDGINQPPLPPVAGFSPRGDVVATHTPELKWEPATDPDISDQLRYEVVLSRDSKFSGRTYISEESVYDQPSVKIRTPLLENRQYFWKVRSIDLADVRSAWSKTSTFWVNNINEAPDRPIRVIKPQNLEEITPATVIWWLPSSDPDPRDRLSYHIEFADSPISVKPLLNYLVSKPLVASKTEDQLPPEALGVSLYSIPELGILKDNTLYYFRIIAVDQAGLIGNSASPPIRIAFNLKNDPPLAVTKGFHPTRNMIVKTLRPEIAWEASRDPDFSDYQPNLTYQIELSTDSQFPEDDTRICEAPAGQTTLTIPEDLTENTRWFYRIRACDQHGSYSLWSPLNSFITNAINEAPYQITAGFLPKDSMVVETTHPLISWLPAGDPDPNQSERDLYYQIRYFYYANGKKKMGQVSSKVGLTSVHLPELKEDQYYYYQIAAVDPDGKSSEWSPLICFGVNADDQPPAYFQLLSPYFKQDSVAMNSSFIWHIAHDKDPGSRLTYTLYYATDSLFSINSREVAFEQPETDTLIFYSPPEQLNYATRYFWKVVAIDNNGNQRWASGTDNRPFVFTTVGLRRSVDDGNISFRLHQNYPNPFNAETLIRYEVPAYGPVDVSIYDLIGEKIKTLVNGNHAQGIYNVYWNGTDQNGTQVSNGVYICQLTSRGFTTHIKVVFLR